MAERAERREQVRTRSLRTGLRILLLALMIVPGLIDAVSFIALGRVFTANMTGNVVLLAFAVAGVEELSILRSATALTAFVVGAVVGGRIANAMRSGPPNRWIAVAFGVETLLLLAATSAAGAVGYESLAAATGHYAMIVLCGLAMGVRNATIRIVGVPDLTTTALTMEITSLVAQSSLGGGRNPRWLRQSGAIFAVFVSAVVGVWLLKHSLVAPLALSAVITALSALAVFYLRPAK